MSYVPYPVVESTGTSTPQRSMERTIRLGSQCPTLYSCTSVLRIVPIYFNASVISVLYPMYAPNAGECRTRNSKISSIETPENIVEKEKTVKKKKTNEGKVKKKKRKNTEEISTGDNTKKSKTEASVLIKRKVTTKVEESIVIRDKKRLDIYVRKLNNLHAEKIVMEEHYLKTINTLMNKYVAVSKESKTFHSTRDQNMINDDQKVLHSEMLLFLGQVLTKNSLKFEIMFPTYSVSIHC
eukprot:scaffold34856_cov59-Attheya_sp.AAC.1